MVGNGWKCLGGGVRMTTCTAVRADGQPCGGPARGSGYCFAHDPDLQAKRQAARRAGGHGKRSTSRLDKHTPHGLRPVLDRLYAALDGVAEGSLTPQQGSSMASIAGAIIRTFEVAELEARLQHLE